MTPEDLFEKYKNLSKITEEKEAINKAEHIELEECFEELLKLKKGGSKEDLNANYKKQAKIRKKLKVSWKAFEAAFRRQYAAWGEYCRAEEQSLK